MAEFDRHSQRYEETLNRSLGGDTASDYYYRHKARYLRRLLEPAFAGRILDYGCGVGLLAQAVCAELPNVEIHGFDVSDASVRQAAARLPAPRAKFTSALDEVPSACDVAILCNVLHHVAPAQREQLLREVATRLAPGGRMIIFEHNPWNPATRSVVARCPFDEHAVLLSRAEAIECVRAAGLQVVRSDYILFFPAALSGLQPVEAALGWLPLGAQFAVTARV